MYNGLERLPALLIESLPLLTNYLPVPKELYPNFIDFLLCLPLNLARSKFLINYKTLGFVSSEEHVPEVVYRDWMPELPMVKQLIHTEGQVTLTLDF
jgi:hypothetical protein